MTSKMLSQYITMNMLYITHSIMPTLIHRSMNMILSIPIPLTIRLKGLADHALALTLDPYQEGVHSNLALGQEPHHHLVTTKSTH